MPWEKMGVTHLGWSGVFERWRWLSLADVDGKVQHVCIDDVAKL